ncbi:hypothetical protein [Cupriavidus alkaliphilus]|uniref:hypothetical protein n=1 Tax=Cupriavidus alkaliphilus TaxID=942866 RepID=UPI0008156B2D|nr:hypothetical protein [Cupriavidus alkaliphilus]SCB19350.1 hypothetical protein GA0116996_104415 [Cupriavidus alkaliphilus]
MTGMPCRMNRLWTMTAVALWPMATQAMAQSVAFLGHTLTMANAAADPQLRRQMQAVGIDLPAPGVVSGLILRGLRDNVPALKAKRQFLD